MFCPVCGVDNQSANAYCKKCGEWLPDIKRRSSSFGGDTPQQNILTGLFFNALSAMAAIFSAIALYGTYLRTGDAKWSIYLVTAFCLCIAGWQASSFFVGLKLRKRLKEGREDSAAHRELEDNSTPVLNAADMTSVVGAPSVTEGTTRVLDPVRRSERDTR